MSRPGQNVVEVPKRSGSQCVPSADVQTGVAGSRATHPTAMNPRRQRRTDVTRLSGSSGARRRQSSLVHVADAGGRGVVKATGSGPTVACDSNSAAAGVVIGSEAAGGVTSACEGATDGAGSTGLAHGFAMAMPTNAMHRTTTSAVTRRSFRPPVLGDP
jgi:hypothetical protein